MSAMFTELVVAVTNVVLALLYTYILFALVADGHNFHFVCVIFHFDSSTRSTFSIYMLPFKFVSMFCHIGYTAGQLEIVQSLKITQNIGHSLFVRWICQQRQCVFVDVIQVHFVQAGLYVS